MESSQTFYHQPAHSTFNKNQKEEQESYCSQQPSKDSPSSPTQIEYGLNFNRKKQPKTKDYQYQVVRVRIIRQKVQLICDRYFINYFNKDLDRMVDKIQKMNQHQKSNKYTTESAAVVAAFEYPDQIRMRSTVEFCRRNGLCLLAFNKKYKMYYFMFVKEKLSEKYQQSYTQLIETPTYQVPSKCSRVFSEINNATEAFSIIYDVLFKQDYFQINRRAIIEGVIMCYEDVSSQVLRAIDQISEPFEKIYYVLFHTLKALKATTYFKDYKLAVQNRTGILLQESIKESTLKVFQEYFSENSLKYLNGNIYGIEAEEKQF